MPDEAILNRLKRHRAAATRYDKLIPPCRWRRRARRRSSGTSTRSAAGKHLGFVGDFSAMSMAASSALTRESLSWEPTGPTLAEDVGSGACGTA